MSKDCRADSTVWNLCTDTWHLVHRPQSHTERTGCVHMYYKSIWLIALQSSNEFNLPSCVAQNSENLVPCSNCLITVHWWLATSVSNCSLQQQFSLAKCMSVSVLMAFEPCCAWLQRRRRGTQSPPCQAQFLLIRFQELTLGFLLNQVDSQQCLSQPTDFVNRSYSPSDSSPVQPEGDGREGNWAKESRLC